MIESFADVGTEDVFHGRNGRAARRACPPTLWAVARRELDQLDATVSLAALRDSGKLAIDASLVKMVWLPLIGTLGAWLCGFRGAELGILFLYIGSPTAAASYVMARAANGNHELAASIIVITTLMAAITTNIGIFILQWGGWI